MIKFGSEHEELQYLRYAIGHFFSGQSEPKTYSALASREYGYELLEEYYDYIKGAYSE